MKQKVTRRQKDVSRLLRDRKKMHKDILKGREKDQRELQDDKHYHPHL